MKFWGKFLNDIPGILNIGIFLDWFHEYLMNLTRIFFRWIKKYDSG